MTRRRFGRVRQLPSGRWQAAYTHKGKVYKAPHTFERERATKSQRDAGILGATDWLNLRQAEITAGTWVDPDAPVDVTLFGAYAAQWLAHRELKPRTREGYQGLLNRHILPTFADVALTAITSARVRDWYAALDRDRPTTRAHAYALLRTIMGDAVADEDTDVQRNPVHIRGAGITRRARRIDPLSVPQLEQLVKAMPERFQSLALVTAWCALRFGEAAALRRSDIDLTNGVIKVRRAVSRIKGDAIVGDPKSDAGIRDVNIPPHLLPMIRDHLRDHVGKGRDSLVWPAADGVSYLAPSSLYRPFKKAREAAGVPGMRWHDLRHTGSVLAAAAGATQAELMARLGHSTAAASQRYQHAAANADKAIAAALSRMATGE